MKLFKKYLLLPLIAIIAFAFNLNAQMEFPEDKVSWKFTLEQNGCEAFIVAEITCVEHWHVYAANLPEGTFLLPTEVEPDKSSNYEVVGKVIEPKPEFYHDEAADEDIYQHSNRFTLKRKIKILSEKDFTLKGRFSFQTCDESHCLPPFDTDFILKVKGCAKEEDTEANTGVTFKINGLDDDGIEFPEDKVSWEFSVEQKGCDVTVIADVTCVEGWHIYAANLPEDSYLNPTRVDPEESSNYKVIGDVIEPKPDFYHDEITDEDIYQHANSIRLERKIKVSNKEDFTLKGTFSFITCGEGRCLSPFETDFEVEVKGCEGGDDDTVAQNKGMSSDDEDDKSLITIFFLAFLSGFAALLTPCVFPMIPMTVSFFTKQSKSKAQGVRNAVIYGISIIIIYVLLGTLVTSIFGSDALNALSTNVYFNVAFFVLLVIFAVSFMGAFEITLPSSWVNKADSASEKGGLIGIFFMAFTLALVSFSCTGPIVGTLLVEAADIGGIAPVIGMFGFSLALALPFALFAAFPGWMNALPQSGGWLTSVKVFLGFLELALAFKFLSNADLVVQGHYLERELFLAIWIGIFGVLAMYLFGFIQLPHDSPIGNLSVGRTLLGTTVVIFVIYLIPGLSGAPLKLISGFPPPMSYSESPTDFGGGGSLAVSVNADEKNEHANGMHPGPQGIPVFHDLDEGLAYAKKVNKPAFLDFTGHACVNCRRMEEGIWGESGVIEIMRKDIVIISLYVDDKRDLPKDEHREVEVNGRKVKITTIGKKWSILQSTTYKTNTQPYYRMLGPDGQDLANGSADYEHHGNVTDFQAWLEEGIELYNKAK